MRGRILTSVYTTEKLREKRSREQKFAETKDFRIRLESTKGHVRYYGR